MANTTISFMHDQLVKAQGRNAFPGDISVDLKSGDDYPALYPQGTQLLSCSRDTRDTERRSVLIANAEEGAEGLVENGFVITVNDNHGPTDAELGRGESNNYQWLCAATGTEPVLDCIEIYLRDGFIRAVRDDLDDRFGAGKRL